MSFVKKSFIFFSYFLEIGLNENYNEKDIKDRRDFRVFKARQPAWLLN